MTEPIACHELSPEAIPPPLTIPPGTFVEAEGDPFAEPKLCEPCQHRSINNPDGSPRTWLLTVDEGVVGLACPDPECGGSHPADDIVEFQMNTPIRVTATFVPEHENLGGWHWGMPCDCGWWFEIEPVVEVESPGPQEAAS